MCGAATWADNTQLMSKFSFLYVSSSAETDSSLPVKVQIWSCSFSISCFLWSAKITSGLVAFSLSSSFWISSNFWIFAKSSSESLYLLFFLVLSYLSHRCFILKNQKQKTTHTKIHKTIQCHDAFVPISPGPWDMAIQPQGPLDLGRFLLLLQHHTQKLLGRTHTKKTTKHVFRPALLEYTGVYASMNIIPFHFSNSNVFLLPFWFRFLLVLHSTMIFPRKFATSLIASFVCCHQPQPMECAR